MMKLAPGKKNRGGARIGTFSLDARACSTVCGHPTRGTNIFVTLTRIFDQNLLCIVLWPAGRACGIWANVPTASKKWFSLRLSFIFVGLDPRNIFRKALAEIRRFPVFLAFREAGGEREWGGLLRWPSLRFFF